MESPDLSLRGGRVPYAHKKELGENEMKADSMTDQDEERVRMLLQM